MVLKKRGREKGEVSVIPQIVCICFIQLYSHSLLFCYHKINTNKKESMLDTGPRAELEDADHYSRLIDDNNDMGAAEALAEEEELTKSLVGAASPVGLVSGVSKIVVL